MCSVAHSMPSPVGATPNSMRTLKRILDAMTSPSSGFVSGAVSAWLTIPAMRAFCTSPFSVSTWETRVIGQNVLVEGLVPGVVVGGGVVEFVPANCVAPAGDDGGGLVVLRGLLPGVFEGCVGGHGRQDCCCWLRVG